MSISHVECTSTQEESFEDSTEIMMDESVNYDEVLKENNVGTSSTLVGSLSSNLIPMLIMKNIIFNFHDLPFTSVYCTVYYTHLASNFSCFTLAGILKNFLSQRPCTSEQPTSSNEMAFIPPQWPTFKISKFFH